MEINITTELGFKNTSENKARQNKLVGVICTFCVPLRISLRQFIKKHESKFICVKTLMLRITYNIRPIIKTICWRSLHVACDEHILSFLYL